MTCSLDLQMRQARAVLVVLGLQLERDALVAKTDVLERCLLTGKEEPVPSNEPSPTTSGGQPTSRVRTRR